MPTTDEPLDFEKYFEKFLVEHRADTLLSINGKHPSEVDIDSLIGDVTVVIEDVCIACGAEWDVSQPIKDGLCTPCNGQRYTFIAGFKRAAIRFHFAKVPTEEELDKWLTALPFCGKTLEAHALECWQEHIAEKGKTE